MIGIDANFLIACEIKEHESHEAVHAILNRLAEEGGRFALAPQVLAEFLHVVTDGRRLQQPHPMRLALERAELWRSAVDVTMLTPGPDAVALFFHWMSEHCLGRKRILDTMLAATFAAANVSRLATIDSEDFQVFGVFELITPA